MVGAGLALARQRSAASERPTYQLLSYPSMDTEGGSEREREGQTKRKYSWYGTKNGIKRYYSVLCQEYSAWTDHCSCFRVVEDADSRSKSNFQVAWFMADQCI